MNKHIRNQAIMRQLHERDMQRRIRRILAENRKHPERCINIGEMLAPAVFQQPGVKVGQQGEIFLSDIDRWIEEMERRGYGKEPMP